MRLCFFISIHKRLLVAHPECHLFTQPLEHALAFTERNNHAERVCLRLVDPLGLNFGLNLRHGERVLECICLAHRVALNQRLADAFAV